MMCTFAYRWICMLQSWYLLRKHKTHDAIQVHTLLLQKTGPGQHQLHGAGVPQKSCATPAPWSRCWGNTCSMELVFRIFFAQHQLHCAGVAPCAVFGILKIVHVCPLVFTSNVLYTINIIYPMTSNITIFKTSRVQHVLITACWIPVMLQRNCCGSAYRIL